MPVSTIITGVTFSSPVWRSGVLSRVGTLEVPRGDVRQFRFLVFTRRDDDWYCSITPYDTMMNLQYDRRVEMRVGLANRNGLSAARRAEQILGERFEEVMNAIA